MEYASNWEETKRRVYRKTRRCCWCFFQAAKVVHHVKYTRSLPRRLLGLARGSDFDKSNVGYEIPGWDVFGLCDRCHENAYGRSLNPSSLHYTGEPKPKWIKVESFDHVVLNHNTAPVIWRLRVTWFVIGHQRLFLALVGLMMAFIVTGLMRLF